ncbi:gamma-glutamylcyclotransferase family protein [Tautonia marina]|uniref:gamma-glutamylcyclotransferase family protein n=1 Tax=Tautonia marina TaxID=2653855 RepID=UPI00126124F9|nr:gamma-glutamylcyclotransferase family protein [Tautonia marina]
MDACSDSSSPGFLFAYGTLGPNDAGAARRGGWNADAVRGRLYDLGPYPALIDWDDPEAGWVEGHVRSVEPIELLEVLDPYEGVAEGEFLRIVVRTRMGREVWVYVFPHPVPEGAVGPLPRWEGPRVDLSRGDGR